MKDNQLGNVINLVYSFLDDSLEHSNKEIDYILYDKDKKIFNIIASDKYEEAIEIKATEDTIIDYYNVPEWDYNFDYYIYNELEIGKKIKYMSNDVHYGIWNSIKELYPTDIDCKEGLNRYINYCRKNKITKEFLDKELKLDTPDIMPLFKNLNKEEVR